MLSGNVFSEIAKSFDFERVWELEIESNEFFASAGVLGEEIRIRDAVFSFFLLSDFEDGSLFLINPGMDSIE
jgi:hypothetical protein